MWWSPECAGPIPAKNPTWKQTGPGQTGFIEHIFRDPDPDSVVIDPEKRPRFLKHPRPKIHRIVHSSQIDHQLVVPRCDELAMGGVSPENLWILHLELKDIAMSPAKWLGTGGYYNTSQL